MRTLDETKRTLASHMRNLHDQFDVQRIRVYGSLARGTAKAQSDVDLLVEFSATPGLFHMARLQAHLESLLGLRVDLATPESLHPRLRAEVQAYAVDVAAGA